MVNTPQNSEIDENGESLVRNDTTATFTNLNMLEKRTESELVVENSDQDLHANFLKSEVQEENDGKDEEEELDVIEEENKNI